MSAGLPSSHVLHVVSRLGRGGAELRTLDVVDESGLGFDFMAISGERAALDDDLVRRGHRVHHLRVHGPIGALRAASLMRRREVRAVHSHLGAASGLVMVSARLARVPVRITHFRSDAVGGTASRRRSMKLFLSRAFVSRWATALVGVSESALDGWDPRWREDQRAQVIPNGVDPAALAARSAPARSTRPGADDRLVVANVARLEASKNRPQAIRIWGELASRRRVDLVLAGPVSDQDAAAAARAAADPITIATGSRIEIVGEVSNVPAVLGAAHVLLMTSVREGLPGVLLESIACDTPVVASDLPGVRRIAERLPGVTVCRLEDPDALWADAVERAADTRVELNSSFFGSEFDVSEVTRRMLTLWGITGGRAT